MCSPSDEELESLKRVAGCLFTTVLLLLIIFAFWVGSTWGQTPTPVPDCPLSVTEGAATIYLIAVYAHEDPTRPGMRYISTTLPQTLEPGEVARPGPYEGFPIGFEWYWEPPEFSKSSTMIKECGDTGRVFPPIFSDGFETGDTSRWASTHS